MIVVGAVIATDGSTMKDGAWKPAGAPGTGLGAAISKGPWPSVCTGTVSLCETSEIQNVASIWAACAFGPEGDPVLAPTRKSMFAVPPPSWGALGLVEIWMVMVFVMDLPVLALRSTVFGSSRMAWVIVFSFMNGSRFCGSRRVFAVVAVWLGNLTNLRGLLLMTNGVILSTWMLGGPEVVVLGVGATPWALIVVPCGIEAIRFSVSICFGLTVDAGTRIHSPGSKCMPVAGPSAFPVAGLVTSWMVCTYGTPLRKISPCSENPRLGTLPRGSAKASVSVVRLISRTLSGTPCVGFTGNVVGVAVLCGRKIVLRPFPAKVPLKLSNTRRGGGGVVEISPERSLLVTPCISKLDGRLIVAPSGLSVWAAMLSEHGSLEAHFGFCSTVMSGEET